ncbi:MAG: 50S ribosomal protein L24 [Gemmatimonadetes bacterium]|nr:50S ribosomal protein L24 [Gemmatimonadota bacterium]
MRIRKGDQVEVISGVYTGQRGRVLHVWPKKERVLVEGINNVKRHTRPNPNNQQGGIVEKEAPLHVSNLMIVDSQTDERTRIRIQRLEDGARVRIAQKSGEQIPEVE